MNTNIASNFYNNSGIIKINEPFSERSIKLFNRVRPYCEKIVFNGAKSLEIGCGNGRFSFELEKMGCLATGIDCADKIIEYAVKFANKTNSLAKFIIGDALNIPFQKDIFDLVFLFGNNIVEFSYSDIDKLCSQITHILNNNGVFCVEMNDMFVHYNGKLNDMKNYSYENSQLTNYYEIPDKGLLPYHSYMWTVGIAKFIFEKYFGLVKIQQIDAKRFWIECKIYS